VRRLDRPREVSGRHLPLQELRATFSKRAHVWNSRVAMYDLVEHDPSSLEPCVVNVHAILIEKRT